MDNFMDKLAQKWNAGELIKANSAAEAMELKRLQEQVAEYETILQEMRKLNLKNAELTEASKKLVTDGILEMQKLLKDKEESNPTLEAVKAIQEQLKELEELIHKEAEQKKEADDIMSKTEEFVHKENVKVYRNVQAVVVDSLKEQTEELLRENTKTVKGIKGIKPLLIVVLLLAAANIVLQLLPLFGVY